MKKTKLFLLPLLILGNAAALASCGENYDAFVKEAVDSVAVLLDSVSGREIYIDYEKTIQAEDYKSFLGLKEIKVDDQELNVEWKYDEAKWYRSTYSGDETRYKFTPIYSDDETAGVFDTTLGVKISYKGSAIEKTWNIHVNKLAYVVTDIPTFQQNYANDSENFPKKISAVGKVTAWFEPSTDHLYAGVFVGDGEYGMMLYAGQLSNIWKELNFKIGDYVLFCGEVAPYSGLAEVKPSYMEILSDDDPRIGDEPVVINGNELGPTGLPVHQSSLVKYDGLTFKSVRADGAETDGYKVGSHVNIKCVDEQNREITIRVNYHIGKTKQEAEKAMVDTWTPNVTKLNFNGVIGVYSPNPQLVPVYNIEPFDVIPAN